MNLPDLVRFWARTRPDHDAIAFEGAAESWSAFDAATDDLARGLAARGITRGDRVAVLMHNRPELARTMVAVLKLGAICVPLNFRLLSGELAELLTDADCSLVVTEESLLSLVADGDGRHDVVSLGSTAVPGYDTLLGTPGPAPSAGIADDDGAFLCYTSGTTGAQKGALLTHRSVLAPAQAQMIAYGLSWRDRVLVPAPLVYTGSVVSVFVQLVIYPGATMVLLADFDPERSLEIMVRERVTAATFVPVIWQRMAAHPGFADAGLAAFTYAAAGGAPVATETLRAYRDRGVPLNQVYGLTEASGLVTSLPWHDALHRPESCGRALVGTEIRVDAAVGEVGEVLVRGPHVMREYWRRPEATAETVVDGWLHTGDLGRTGDEGFLSIVDRSKDLVISGGINVYPAEIEKVLAAVPGVGDLAVIGVPDEVWGEVPMVVFHSERDASAVVAELAAAAGSRLARFKQPRHAVASPDPLPRTFSGKLTKAALRERFREVPPEAVSLRDAAPA
ncbi:class I adenylate-forming enzyme family protein [Pseudonocardia sp. HH130629-09]|uniref:class I adenylate-forming enzyme family protein n=1 Tax=Pseudonocardia sp. HH130629-09 TaxID=1641402 RepID=UPI0006CB5390|nr:AMP-binding protein [Pseudonocardia sp. HH130629-09]ALE84854.1 AMP-dependent acyl-CoA synthetase [Pseudonocardia sp. HH130629-09]